MSAKHKDIVANMNASENIKAYHACQYEVELMLAELVRVLEEKGKLDVGGAVGKGVLNVIRDLGMKEPYIGQIPLVSGEIAEYITSYFATSEQIPSVCALGVLVNPDMTVAVAGGFLIQLLPTSDDEIITRVENGLKNVPSVTTMLAEGKTPLEICKTVLPEFNVEILDESDCEYKCNCSR